MDKTEDTPSSSSSKNEGKRHLALENKLLKASKPHGKIKEIKEVNEVKQNKQKQTEQRGQRKSTRSNKSLAINLITNPAINPSINRTIKLTIKLIIKFLAVKVGLSPHLILLRCT